MLPFEKFNKIPRLSREMVITEKIDGTNAQIYIVPFSELRDEASSGEGWEELKKHILYERRVDDESCFMFAGSRKRWLDTSSKGDNYGFAKWVEANAEELFKLGEGRHYGEYYGKGIQRGYGLDEKRFALFNVKKWEDPEVRPKCCEVVPILYRGMFDTNMINIQLKLLKISGSKIAPNFMNPEGIVIYHKASGKLFKKTIKNDESPKGKE
jgi:hypothetical protein